MRYSDFDVNVWHTYGYLWTESELIMFVDGKEFGRYNLNDISILDNNDMAGFDEWITLHLSNQIYSPEYCKANVWAQIYQIDTEQTENLDMQIDYIRVYQSCDSDEIMHIKK